MNLSVAQEFASKVLQLPWIPVVIRLAFLIGFCLPLAIYLGKWLRRWVARHSTAQRGMIAGNAIQYMGFIIIGISVMHELGFSLAPLLGAAGIVGVALGFASQTSVSNIISGLFLIAEQPFEVGDVITVGDTTGIVESIDVLSVKLRSFDNHFIRIPNETLVKAQVRNVTYYPVRRVDIPVSVAYKEDLSQVFAVLRRIAERNPYCLDEPAPLLVVDRFADSSINILLGVWCVKANFLPLKNSIYFDIHQGFREADIEIPFPHQVHLEA